MYVKVLKTQGDKITLTREVWYKVHEKFKNKYVKRLEKTYNRAIYGTRVIEDTNEYDEHGNEILNTREIYGIE